MEKTTKGQGGSTQPLDNLDPETLEVLCQAKDAGIDIAAVLRDVLSQNDSIPSYDELDKLIVWD
jgi:hypothetical protein